MKLSLCIRPWIRLVQWRKAPHIFNLNTFWKQDVSYPFPVVANISRPVVRIQNRSGSECEIKDLAPTWNRTAVPRNPNRTQSRQHCLALSVGGRCLQYIIFILFLTPSFAFLYQSPLPCSPPPEGGLGNYGVVAVVVVRWSKERKWDWNLFQLVEGSSFLSFAPDRLWKLPDLFIIAA